MKPRERYFTMVELMVVMAIILIIGGILFPAVTMIKERSQRAVCLGNLRQIGIALNTYIIDNKDTLPVCERLDSIYGLPTLKELMMPYLSNKGEIFCCPTDKSRPGSTWTSSGTSYEWNTFVSGHKIDKTSFIVAGMTIVAPLLGDANGVHSNRRNYLYSDGKVQDTLEVLIDNDSTTYTEVP